MSAQTNKLTIQNSEITLLMPAIDNLASEFYGRVLTLAVGESVETVVEFLDIEHMDTKSRMNGLDNLNAFMQALDSFRKPKIQPNI